MGTISEAIMVSPPFHLSSVVSDPSLLFNLMAHTRVHTYTRTGDISTLALPEVVDDLLAKAKDAA